MPGSTMTMGGSLVGLDGVTVKSGQGHGIIVDLNSSLGFGATPSLVTGNGLSGISVGPGSSATVVNVTISNNRSDGITVHNGGTLILTNDVNGADAPVDIFANAGYGVRLKAGRLSALPQTNPDALVRIHDNGGGGLELEGSAEVGGHVKFDGNDANNAFGAAQIVVGPAGILTIGKGAQIQGGLAALFKSFVFLGSGGPLTLTGGAVFQTGSSGLMVGANSVDTITCDSTSWVTTDGQSIVGSSTCPSDGPSGAQGPAGPAGPSGPAGPQGAQGLTGISGRQVITAVKNEVVGKDTLSTVTASCPAGKLVIGGGADLGTTAPPGMLTVQSSQPTSDSTGWIVAVRNTAANSRTVQYAAVAICVNVQ